MEMEKTSRWQRIGGRNFKSDIRVGERGEEAAEEIFRHIRNVRNVTDLRKAEEWQKKDVDFGLEMTNGNIKYVEVKNDTMAHITGNIAFEMYSNGKPGCLARTASDYVFYRLEAPGITYVLDTEKLRRYVSSDVMPRRKLVRMGQREYGYLLKIADLKALGIIVQEFRENREEEAA